MIQDLSKPHFVYRPDIDGMRALAVLAVILFHIYPKALPTGFIGVDLFFVISGYLISSIIVQDLQNQSFSLKRFYQRRVQRIFPVLLTVLALSYGLAWIVMTDDEFTRFSRYLSGGVFFAANWISWGEAGYFDVASESKPLLHLWSLGIEEQFYLLWPLLLLFFLRFKRASLLLSSFLAIASFILCVWLCQRDLSTGFYLPFSRAWELLAGALIALFTQKNRLLLAWASGKQDRRADLLSCAGLGALGLSLLLIDQTKLFPGYWASLPVLAASLLILAGPGALINRKLLSQTFLVKIGLISFSWYLWHWPLLSFVRIIESAEPSSRWRNLILLASLALAVLSYRFIERPLRRSSHRLVLSGLLVLWLMLGGVGILSTKLPGFYQREVVKLNTLYAQPDLADGHTDLNQPCDLPTDQRKLFLVCAKDSRGQVSYALIGDSKAHALHRGLVRTSTDAGRWLFVGGTQQQGATIPVLSDAPEFAAYQQQSRIAMDLIQRDAAIRTVVFVVSMRALFQLSDQQKVGNQQKYNPHYLQQLSSSTTVELAYQGLKLAIQNMQAAGKQVVFVVDNPPLPEAVDCAGRRTSSTLLNRWLGLENRGARAECFMSIDQFKQDTQIYWQLIRKLQSDFPTGFEVFDPTGIYCDEQSKLCGPVKNNRLMYSYTDHISDYAAGLVGSQLNQRLQSKSW